MFFSFLFHVYLHFLLVFRSKNSITRLHSANCKGCSDLYSFVAQLVWSVPELHYRKIMSFLNDLLPPFGDVIACSAVKTHSWPQKPPQVFTKSVYLSHVTTTRDIAMTTDPDATHRHALRDVEEKVAPGYLCFREQLWILIKQEVRWLQRVTMNWFDWCTSVFRDWEIGCRQTHKMLFSTLLIV